MLVPGRRGDSLADCLANLCHRSADAVTAAAFGECVSCQESRSAHTGETSINEPKFRADGRDGARKPTAERKADSLFDRGRVLAPG
jgi:hypothetical protein